MILLFILNALSLLLKLLSLPGTNATSVFIDVLNDTGDCVGLGVLILGLYLAKSKISIVYPYGRKRALYVFSLLAIMIFSGLIFAVALFKTISIIYETPVLMVASYSQVMFKLAAGINIAGLVTIYMYSRRNIDDPLLRGGLIDSVSDTSGSALALATILLKEPYLDVLGSLIISCIILISALSLGYRYIEILIGRAPPLSILKRVINHLLSIPEIRDVNVFNAAMITEDEYMLTLEVEVDKDMEIEDAEKLSTKIEEEIKRMEPRFKQVVIEFVGEKPGPRTYKEILSEIENHPE
ncbi:MAG: cation diffusion facilitator family transporter [Ignisphaera sp.]